MTGCSALGCTNRNEDRKKQGISFHRFPKNPVQRKLWLQALKRTNWTPSNASILCSLHFSEDQFDRYSQFKIRLKENAVPTIFPKQVPTPCSSCTLQLNSKTAKLSSKAFDIDNDKNSNSSEEKSEITVTLNSLGINSEKEVQDIDGCIQPTLNSSSIQISQEVFNNDRDSQSTSSINNQKSAEGSRISNTVGERIRNLPDSKMEDIPELECKTVAHALYNLPGVKIKKKPPDYDGTSGVQMKQDIVDLNKNELAQNLLVESQKTIIQFNKGIQPNISETNAKKVTSKEDDQSNFNLPSITNTQQISDSDKETELTLNASDVEIEKGITCFKSGLNYSNMEIERKSKNDSVFENIIYSSIIEIKQEDSESDTELTNGKNLHKCDGEHQLKLNLSEVEIKEKNIPEQCDININPTYLLPDIQIKQEIQDSDEEIQLNVNFPTIESEKIPPDLDNNVESTITPLDVEIKKELPDFEYSTEEIQLNLNFPTIERETILPDLDNNEESNITPLDVEIKKELPDFEYSTEPSTSSAGMVIKNKSLDIDNCSIGKTLRKKRKRKKITPRPSKKRKINNKSCENCSGLAVKLQEAENKLKNMMENLNNKNLQISTLKEEADELTIKIAMLEKKALNQPKQRYEDYKFTYTGREPPLPRNNIPIKFLFTRNKLTLPKPAGIQSHNSTQLNK